MSGGMASNTRRYSYGEGIKRDAGLCALPASRGKIPYFWEAQNSSMPACIAVFTSAGDMVPANSSWQVFL